MNTQRSAICIYCLCAVTGGDLTVDHVIARSWYPTTALRFRPWKVPACIRCNNRFSRIEEHVLRCLALGLSPADATVAKIVAKVKRSIDPRFGRSVPDRQRRQRAREEMISRLRPVSSMSEPGMLPFFKGNLAAGSRTGVIVPSDEIEEIGTKWIRGVHYAHFGDLIPKSASIDIHFVTDEVAREAFGDMIEHAIALNKGPGVQVLIFDAVEGPERITQYAFKIWREMTLYGTLEIDLRKTGIVG